VQVYKPYVFLLLINGCKLGKDLNKTPGKAKELQKDLKT